jgi:hypothetical protein
MSLSVAHKTWVTYTSKDLVYVTSGSPVPIAHDAAVGVGYTPERRGAIVRSEPQGWGEEVSGAGMCPGWMLRGLDTVAKGPTH